VPKSTPSRLLGARMNAADDTSGADPALGALRHGAADAAVNIRLTYADEALGLPVDAARGPLPVALLELTRWRQVVNRSNTAMSGLYVEAAVAAGLPRWKGVDTDDFSRHPGWSVWVRENRVELHGPRGIWARGSEDVHPDWRTATTRFGNCALALFGPILGVRVPAGTWEAQFTAEKRRRDLLIAAGAGLVAGALLQCRPYPI
jgi:hypothetical protein